MPRVKQRRGARRSTSSRRRGSRKAKKSLLLKRLLDGLLEIYPNGEVLLMYRIGNAWFALGHLTEQWLLSVGVTNPDPTETQIPSGYGEQPTSWANRESPSYSQTSRQAPPPGSNSPGET